MSQNDFQNTFSAFLSKIEAHSPAQKDEILELLNAKLKAILQEVGPAEQVAAAAPAENKQASKAAPEAAKPVDAVTGSRQSTRVAQAPGGKSQVFLGGDDEPTKPGTASGRRGFAGAGQSSLSFGDDGKNDKTSVKVKHAPGGSSSIQFGDDSTPAQKKDPKALPDESRPSKHHAGRAAVQAPGGKGSDIFGTEERKAVHTSVKTHHAPGGRSTISLGGDAPAAAPSPRTPAGAAAAAPPVEEKKKVVVASAGGDDISAEVLKEISAAIARKGKQRDTFTKFTQNKSKVISVEDLKLGLSGMGFELSDAQVTRLMTNTTKKPASEGMSFSDFVKLQQV